MRISDWSSDVCSSDLRLKHGKAEDVDLRVQVSICRCKWRSKCCRLRIDTIEVRAGAIAVEKLKLLGIGQTIAQPSVDIGLEHRNIVKNLARCQNPVRDGRSEEHTSELQSLMRNSYAVFCLITKNIINTLTFSFYTCY